VAQKQKRGNQKQYNVHLCMVPMPVEFSASILTAYQTDFFRKSPVCRGSVSREPKNARFMFNKFPYSRFLAITEVAKQLANCYAISVNQF
jgi:hypothetical protein